MTNSVAYLYFQTDLILLFLVRYHRLFHDQHHRVLWCAAEVFDDGLLHDDVMAAEVLRHSLAANAAAIAASLS